MLDSGAEHHIVALLFKKDGRRHGFDVVPEFNIEAARYENRKGGCRIAVRPALPSRSRVVMCQFDLDIVRLKTPLTEMTDYPSSVGETIEVSVFKNRHDRASALKSTTSVATCVSLVILRMWTK